MIDIKNQQEIESMRQGGKILAEVLFEILKHVKPGVSELDIDQMAEKLIREKGAEPGFQKVKGYKHSICAATNEVVVHGIPRADYIFKEGDMVCIDCGVYLDGLHTDMAETILVSAQSAGRKGQSEEEKFLETGKRALDEAIKVAVVGNRIGHISKTIQDIVEKEAGYSIVRTLIGHGVGKELHEEPEVPGYVAQPLHKTPALVPGMTIAIEIIYCMGGHEVVYAGWDDWTIKTKDNSLSAVFERTVLITKDQPEILTR